MSNGYTGSDSANEAEANHIADSLALHASLRQVNSNTTGDCEDCGEPIPAARLEAIPNACYCVACQSKFEGAGSNKPRLLLRNVYVP
ncbi:hypothetical protein [Burkholderia phage BCSR129]|nr:hypothetical protein [Burkholderia phage BCSR129]